MRRLLTIISLPLFLLVAALIPFHRLPPLCMFHIMTHYPCPTCGMTRGVSDIARLQFSEAWALNPMSFVFVLWLMTFWGNAVRESFIGRRTNLSIWAERHAILLTITTLAVLAVFGIARIWLCRNGFFAFPGG